MDKNIAAQIQNEITLALNTILAKHGMKGVKNRLAYTDIGFKLTFEATTPGAVDSHRLAQVGRLFPHLDLTKTISICGLVGSYRIVDVKSRGSNCWIIENIESKKIFKVDLHFIERNFSNSAA